MNQFLKSASVKGGMDAAMAGFAALAVGFVAFAMPGDLFESAVSASGLPALLPAAAPPLGGTARFGVVAGAALLSFGGLFLLLRALGAAPRRARDAAPRVRRADRHPDAPSRRPLLAGHELGEPVIDWPAPAPAIAPAALPPEDDAQDAAIEDAVVYEPEPEPEPVEAESAPLEDTPPAPEAASPPPAGAGQPFPFSDDYADAPPPQRPLPSRPLADESIPGLMERLESGLAVRAHRARRADAAPGGIAPLPGELRLQSAIDSLQRLARDR